MGGFLFAMVSLRQDWQTGRGDKSELVVILELAQEDKRPEGGGSTDKAGQLWGLGL